MVTYLTFDVLERFVPESEEIEEIEEASTSNQSKCNEPRLGRRQEAADRLSHGSPMREKTRLVVGFNARTEAEIQTNQEENIIIVNEFAQGVWALSSINKWKSVSTHSSMPSLEPENFRNSDYLSDGTSRTSATQDVTQEDTSDKGCITTCKSDDFKNIIEVVEIQSDSEGSELDASTTQVTSDSNDTQAHDLEYLLSVVLGKSEAGIMQALKSTNITLGH